MRIQMILSSALLIGCGSTASAPPTDPDVPDSPATGVTEEVVVEEEEEVIEDEGTDTDIFDTDVGTLDTGWLDQTTPLPEYWLNVELTVDDAFAMWVDEVALGAEEGWSFVNTYDTLVDLGSDGPHVIAVHGYDTANVISGLMAHVELDGQTISLSGDGSWVMTTTEPPADWTEVNFDDSRWQPAQLCADTSPWGDRPTDLTSQGAQWVWHSTNCRELGQAWFRMKFTITP